MRKTGEPLTQGVSSQLTESEYKALKAETDKRAVTISKLIRVLLREWLEAHRGEEAK